jgi:Ricin-type beta-trefoil lectin domain
MTHMAQFAVALLIACVLSAAPAFAQTVPWAGGPVIQNARVIAIYWGTPESAFRAAMDRFYAQLMGSSYLSHLSEYSTGALQSNPTNAFRTWFGPRSEQVIGGGSFAGSYVLADDGGGPVETTDIGARLDHEIHIGTIPGPDKDTIYMVHFSKKWQLWLGTNIIGIPVGALEGHGFSAYHAAYYSTFTSRAIVYGAVPNQCAMINALQASKGLPAVCSGWQSAFNNETVSSSHELTEAITDPGSAVVVGGFLSVGVGSDQAWRFPRGFLGLDPNEITDLCDGTDGAHLTVGWLRTSPDSRDNYAVSNSWSNRVNACLMAGPVGTLDGFYRDSSGVPHVYGWAIDPENPGGSIQVHLYFDGPYPFGRGYAVTASGVRTDVNRGTGNPGNHGFDFQVPFEYRDGKAHSVYAYAIGQTSGNNSFLNGSPAAFNNSLPAQNVPQPVMIASGQGPGQCLDITGMSRSAEAPLQMYACTGTDNQRFSYHPETQELRAYNDSSMCLDASSGLGRDGDRLIIWPCNGDANQKWTFNLQNGEIRGVNGKCVDANRAVVANGTAVQIWSCNGGSNQYWFRK